MKQAHLFFRALVATGVLLFFHFSAARAGLGEGKQKAELHPSAAITDETLIDVTRITSWVRNDGLFRWMATGGDGRFPKGTIEWAQNGAWNGLYPKGVSVGAIFAEGVVWGGLVRDGSEPELRVGGSTYQSGTWPGRILTNGSGTATGREDALSPAVRLFRVRTDWQTADLGEDATQYFHTTKITADMVQSIRLQYETDWNNWPAGRGAPFDDRNGNGTYEPAFDIPGVPHADQTIFFITNDLETGRAAIFGAPPIGLECHYTIWGYGRSGTLGNLIFKRVKLIYKGTPSTPSSGRIDSMYIAQFADPDVGAQFDDQIGSDSVRHMGYAYQWKYTDRLYFEYDLAPPAVGYDLLQGPYVPGDEGEVGQFDGRPMWGYRNLPMTTFTWFAASSARSDPELGTYEGGREWYNLLRGYQPRPAYPEGVPLRTRDGSRETRFEYSGDPVTGTGDLDTTDYNRGDRRMVISTGPFSMARGDTQEVVIALVAGHDWERYRSVRRMRANDDVAQYLYDTKFKYIPPSVSVTPDYTNRSWTVLNLRANAAGKNIGAIQATLKGTFSSSTVASATLYDDGAHGDDAAGDGIFGGTIGCYPQWEASTLAASVSYLDGTSVSWDRVEEKIVTAGRVTIENAKIVADNLNGDKIANPGENVRFTFDVVNRTVVKYFELDAFTRLDGKKWTFDADTLAAGDTVRLTYNSNDTSTCFAFNVPADYPDSVFRVFFTVKNGVYNEWNQVIEFPIRPNTYTPSGQPVVHNGPGDWELSCVVVDPAALKMHTYEATIVDSIDIYRNKGFRLVDKTINTIIWGAYALPHPYAHNIPVRDGFKIMRGKNFGKIGVRDDSTRWISPNPVWIRGDEYTLDNHFAFNGGVTTGSQMDNYFYHLKPNFSPSNSVPVEVRFDAANPQKAYRLRRSGPNTGYMIQEWAPFRNVPFTAWDVSDPASPRQLTLGWRDQDFSTTWNPTTSSDGIEVVYIFYRTYDSTMSTQWTMPPNAIENELTYGEKSDMMYSLSLAIVKGHFINESVGTLYIRPWLPLSSKDKFTFSPRATGIAGGGEVPYTFSLAQNYPNPFNPATTIRFSVARRVPVHLVVYNILGQRVRTLIDEEREAGDYTIIWNGDNNASLQLPTGVYFYRLRAGEFVETKKMILVK